MENKFGTRADAMDFYGIKVTTIQKWRAAGIINSIPYEDGDTVRFEYELDPKIKEHIDFMKLVDKRWGR